MFTCFSRGFSEADTSESYGEVSQRDNFSITHATVELIGWQAALEVGFRCLHSVSYTLYRHQNELFFSPPTVWCSSCLVISLAEPVCPEDLDSLPLDVGFRISVLSFAICSLPLLARDSEFFMF